MLLRLYQRSITDLYRQYVIVVSSHFIHKIFHDSRLLEVLAKSESATTKRSKFSSPASSLRISRPRGKLFPLIARFLICTRSDAQEKRRCTLRARCERRRRTKGLIKEEEEAEGRKVNTDAREESEWRKRGPVEQGAAASAVTMPRP